MFFAERKEMQCATDLHKDLESPHSPPNTARLKNGEWLVVCCWLLVVGCGLWERGGRGRNSKMDTPWTLPFAGLESDFAGLEMRLRTYKVILRTEKVSSRT
jgi:hypothetical protein